MKSVIGLTLVGVGVTTLLGCGAAESTESELVEFGEHSEAVLVTATALARGQRQDFNGDGKEDILVIDDLGSAVNLGTSPGGFGATRATWFRSDLPGYSHVIGDFNKDGRTDLLITTATDTALYTGRDNGNFNERVWTSTLFKRDKVDFAVGDFNGDGYSDFIATTATGSTLYTGKSTASGSFNANVWSNTSLKKDVVKITPGNFDGDATTDFLTTSGNGTWEYTGKTSGGFNANVWTTSTLTYGGVNDTRFVVANFDGAGPDDFIVQKLKPAGAPANTPVAFLYTGKSGGGFNANVWTNSSYSLDGSKLLPGDFDGNGKYDFLVQTGSAVIERYWTGTTFATANWSDDRYGGFYDVTFKRGDYNGDGRDDFISQTRPATGNGSAEHTGKSSLGFNINVWANPDLYMPTIY